MAVPMLRPAVKADAEFIFEVKKAALGPYISKVWGWDDGFQRQFFIAEFEPSHIDIILLDGQDIGVMVVERSEKLLFLSEIYILPAFQNRGIGSALIKNLLAEADAKQIPVTLQVLKINPASRLYERLGFAVIEETQNHYQMRR